MFFGILRIRKDPFHDSGPILLGDLEEILGYINARALDIGWLRSFMVIILGICPQGMNHPKMSPRPSLDQTQDHLNSVLSP